MTTIHLIDLLRRQAKCFHRKAAAQAKAEATVPFSTIGMVALLGPMELGANGRGDVRELGNSAEGR